MESWKSQAAKKLERQPTEWERIFANHTTGTYKELLHLNNKKTNNPIKNRARKDLIDISPKKTYS